MSPGGHEPANGDALTLPGYRAPRRLSGRRGDGERQAEVSREHLDRLAGGTLERNLEKVMRDAAVASEIEAGATGPAALGERLVDLRPEDVGVEVVPRK